MEKRTHKSRTKPAPRSRKTPKQKQQKQPQQQPKQQQQQQEQEQKQSTIFKKQNILDHSYPFQILPKLPVELIRPQCVFVNWKNHEEEELLICGGSRDGNCYSYHIAKQQYQWICHYPTEVINSFMGNVVIQCDTINIDTINENCIDKIVHEKSKSITTLLSFGGQCRNETKYTLMMDYQSVWKKDMNELKKYHRNQWISAPFKIGHKEDDMSRICAVMSRSKKKKKNSFLFIIYPKHYIDVFDGTTFQLLLQYTLPFDFDNGSCLIAIDDLDEEKDMIMFHKNNVVLIQYQQDSYTLEFEHLSVGSELRYGIYYSYIRWKDFIVFFGGYNANALNSIYVYSLTKKEWKKSLYKLPFPSFSVFSILDPSNKWVHIIGGTYIKEGKLINSDQHFIVNILELIGLTIDEIELIVGCWIRQEKELGMGWIIEFYTIIANYVN